MLGLPSPSTARPGSDTSHVLARTGEYVATEAGLPVVPGYEISAEIGRGGMGLVLAARDLTLDREVAVKVLLAGHSVELAARRFVRESKITAALPHPGIPPVYAMGTLADGSPFLAMKLIRGKTLAELLRERSSPSDELPRFVQIFEQIAQTIAYAHSRGVIHRDLKPANVMVGAFGEVQVMDWGLAKETGNDLADPGVAATRSTRSGARAADETQAGQIMGTPAYMAPEQARGETASAAADVFALGGILCEMLTGRPTFRGKTHREVLKQSAEGNVVDATARLAQSGADAELVSLAGRCLMPRLADRLADGAAVAAAVALYRAGVESRLRRAEQEKAAAEARTVEQRKKRRVQLALAIAIGFLLLGGGAFAWWQEHKAKQKESDDLRVAAERDGERRAVDVERRLKNEQTRAAVHANLSQAIALSKQYRFRDATALLRTSGDLAKSDAPEMIPEVERATSDLGFVVALDGARLKRSTWIPELGGGGRFDKSKTPTLYRAIFTQYGFDFLQEPESLAARIRESPIRRELVDALDDWSVFETDPQLTQRLLEVARKVEPGAWTDRLRDPAVRANPKALEQLAKDAEADPNVSVAALVALSELMGQRDLDAIPMLTAAHGRYRTDFLLAFMLGYWHYDSANDTQQALAYYRVALAIRPDAVPVLLNVSEIQSEAGNHDEAVLASRDAVRFAPELAEAHHSLGGALLEKGDPAGAVAPLKEAVRLDPLDAVAHSNLGVALLSVGETGEAVAAFQKATKLDPQSAHAWYNIGNGQRAQKDWPATIASYREAARLDPEFASAHQNLGMALLDTGDRVGAEKAFRRVLELDPTNAEVRNELSALVAGRGSSDDLEFLLENVRLQPKNPQAHNDLGLFYYAVGRNAEAVKCYDRAIAFGPKSATFRVNRAAALRKNGQLDEAEQSCRDALRLEPAHAKAHNELGVILFALKRLDEAIVEFEAATRRDPDYAQAFFNLGQVQIQKKDFASAAKSLRVAVKLDPTKARWHKELGYSLWMTKNPSGAAAAYREAVRLDPNDGMAQYNLGFNLYQSGKHVDAIEPLRVAVKLDPKHAEARCWLGAALCAKGEIDAALLEYDEAARLGLKASYFQNLRGEALAQKRDFVASEAAFREAIRLQPANASYLKNLDDLLKRKADRESRIAPPPRLVKP